MPTDLDIALSAAGTALFFAAGQYWFAAVSAGLLLCFPRSEA